MVRRGIKESGRDNPANNAIAVSRGWCVVYTPAIPRAALSSSYSLWLHWHSSAASTALRHRSRNTSAPLQKYSRAKASESAHGNCR